jgi:uncharacterized protein (TIGR03067 family)
MLAKRLARRGVVLSGVLLGAVLSQQAASANVPALVISKAIKVASMMAARAAVRGDISVRIAALTEGVMKSMLLTKLKNVMAVTFAMVVMVGIGAGLLGYRTAAGGQKENKKDEAVTPQKQVAVSDKHGQPEKDAAETEKQRLEGRWVARSAEVHGSPVSDEIVEKAKVTIVISGDRFTATASGAFTNEVGMKGDATLRGTMRIDPNKQPRTFDLVDCRLDAGNLKDVKTSGAEGIYELKGDTLKVCYGPERPTEFKTKPYSYQKLYVFEREKGGNK